MDFAHTELLIELVHRLPADVDVDVVGTIAGRGHVLTGEGGEVGVDFRDSWFWSEFFCGDGGGGCWRKPCCRCLRWYLAWLITCIFEFFGLLLWNQIWIL